MTDGPIPSNHLRRCPDHGVVNITEDGDRWCPCCELDVEARPSAVTDVSFTGTDRRRNITRDLMADLLRALQQDAERADVGPVYVAVAETTKEDLPAGYTHQERWWNVAVVETGNTSREVFKYRDDAHEAIQHIRDGGGYLEPSEPAHGLLDPGEWDPVVSPYCSEVKYTRVDSDTLHIQMTGFPSDNAYSEARRQIGVITDRSDLFVRTISAGGRFEDAKVEVSASDE